MSEWIVNVRNLFFFKRMPKPHVPSKWKRPSAEADYEMQKDWEGFVSPLFWKKDDLTKYPTLKQDLEDLDEHLLPAFWEFNQKAKHYQNRFYLYQWIFMGGALLTTFLGALTTYTYTLDNARDFPEIAGIMTALVSGVTAYFNYVSDQGSPQKRWAKTRRLTEELRTNYYRYLAHLQPYHETDRVQQMRKMVITVRRKEVSDG
jgi:hypothetical protein